MLASTIKRFQLSGFPLTIGRVCQLAFQYASVNGITGISDERQMEGHKWLSRFLKRHPDISLKKARNLSICPQSSVSGIVFLKKSWMQLI